MRAAVPAPVAPAAAGWFPPRRSSAALRACFGEASASKRGGLLARVRPGSGPGPRPALVALVLLSTVFLFAAVLRPAPAPAGSGAPAASGVAAAAAGGVEMRRLMPVPVDTVAAEVEVEERVLRQESYDRDQVIDRILSIAAYEAEERPAADGEGAERDADLQPEVPAEPAPRTSLTERLAFTATECAAREPELLQRVGTMLHDPYMMECARGATAACCAGLQSEASPWHGCTCAAETVWKALQAVPGFVRPLVKTRLTQCGVPLPGAGCPDAAAEEAEVGREGNAAGVQLEGPEAAV